MKRINLNINPKLNVDIVVTNGSRFTRALIEGEYATFYFEPATSEDERKIKYFAVHNADDKGVYSKCWHAHCNGFNMDLCVSRIYNPTTQNVRYHYSLNTYRPFGRTSK